MPASIDGPASTNFAPVPLPGTLTLSRLPRHAASPKMKRASKHAPTGNCVCWGLPFRVDRVRLVHDRPVTIPLRALRAEWLVFLHTSDMRPFARDSHGITSPMRGRGQLGEHAADYILVYADGSEARAAIRRRYQIGAFTRGWGENCTEAVAHCKPRPVRAHHEQMCGGWGHSQTRGTNADSGPWVNWLWAWENPEPRKVITALRIEPRAGVILLCGISAGAAQGNPLRWRPRCKAVLTLPRDVSFDPQLRDHGQLRDIQLDLGQVISALPRPLYPDRNWARTYNNQVPAMSSREILVEYTAHPNAVFHLSKKRTVTVARLESAERAGPLRTIAPAIQRVRLRVVDQQSRQPVAVKLHVHGAAGEYLAPVDRHRIPNAAWFEDYSVDFAHKGQHWCTYIPGETVIDLPLGKVYLEISKGFEIKPLRKVLAVGPATRQITLAVSKVLPWREKGWVSADTHVHFLSPASALLEGSGEGVNIVNLLASQWGGLMTNVGDFDGKTTHGSRDAGGDGEYLVRVGTENRQHILGHISLLGYSGNIIAPMTTGGPDESALGDPVEILLTEWARQCKAQGGVVVLPHFPNPRLEGAAAIVDGTVDGVEMTSWGSLYGGIDPYTLSDWYRYLNCGYRVAAVGGTDKMNASTAVGAVRTYAHIRGVFSYEAWMKAVEAGRTFVTYGPLVEFAVEGKGPGAEIRMTATGGTVHVGWQVASVTVPMSRVELVRNGEIVESARVRPWQDRGRWSVKVERSSWLALLVRGHYRDKPEIVAAHSSPVMIPVKGSAFYAEADALTILEQIEGAIAFLDTVGMRAEDVRHKRMRLILTQAHRALHNRMHAHGYDHKHNAVTDHQEHHA